MRLTKTTFTLGMAGSITIGLSIALHYTTQEPLYLLSMWTGVGLIVIGYTIGAIRKCPPKPTRDKFREAHKETLEEMRRQHPRAVMEDVASQRRVDKVRPRTVHPAPETTPIPAGSTVHRDPNGRIMRIDPPEDDVHPNTRTINGTAPKPRHNHFIVHAFEPPPPTADNVGKWLSTPSAVTSQNWYEKLPIVRHGHFGLLEEKDQRIRDITADRDRLLKKLKSIEQLLTPEQWAQNSRNRNLLLETLYEGDK